MKNLVGRLKSLFNHSRGPGGQQVSFSAIFERFREVLNNNNRALEIITDMGEKLGGEYIFDINYIKSAYSGLSSAMNESIHAFDALTGHKFPRLVSTFGQIDGLIGRMIYGRAPVSRGMVVFYEDITWDMAREVGGKNINLAEMKNALKLNVPGSFAITTDAFDQLIKSNALEDKIRTIDRGTDIDEPALSSLRQLIIDSKIPPELDAAIDEAVKKMKARCGENCFMAVRSSAEEEDGDFSFAGQFETVLNVPLEGRAIKDAYKKVVASLYSVGAMAYQKGLGYSAGRLKMAAGCVLMVDASASGVIYSRDPDNMDTMLINAAWGLGKSVVEGLTDADLYRLKRNNGHEVIEGKIGRKEFMITRAVAGGIERKETPDDMRNRACLSQEQLRALADQAALIESHFRRPQDIEWAIDREGSIFILQSRPLKIGGDAELQGRPASVGGEEPARILMKGKGVVVRKGVGAGRAFIYKRVEDLDKFPRGAVLVAGQDSSIFARVMPYVSAIVTDTGTPTSHMSSLCREFRVPAVVNAGDATKILKHGQEITVSALDEMTVYEGAVRAVAGYAGEDFMKMEDLYEFRKKRYILRYVTPLNLVDPVLDNFSPEGCKTFHDILRFIHEKAVAELISEARKGGEMLKRHAAIKLDIAVPAGIMAIDIGGGLDIAEDSGRATFEQITSVPLAAVVRGMMCPGVWHSEAVSLKVNDFMTSMMRMPDIVSESSEYAGYNVAVVSKEYLNLSLRFGYHFNMIDCYCSENMRNNHIYFRFVGGATDIVKRSRRLDLIAAVLKEHGFNIRIKGDILIARLSNIGQKEIVDILDQTGRLIAYTRQLDAVLNDDSLAKKYAENFLAGKYDI